MATWEDLLKSISESGLVRSQGASPFGQVASNISDVGIKGLRTDVPFVGSPYKERPWDVPTIKEMIDKLKTQQVKTEPDEPEKSNEEGKPEPITTKADTKPVVAKRTPAATPTTEKSVEETSTQQEAPKTDEELKNLLAQYQKDLKWENLGADLEKAAATAYGSLGVTSDEEGYKRRLKEIGMPVEMLEKQREADAKLQEKERAAQYTNPASQRSKTTRDMVKQYLNMAGLKDMSARITDDMSAEQVDTLTKGVFKDAVNQQMDLRRLQESILARKEISDERAKERQLALGERTKAGEEKKKQALNEVSQRQQDINDNLGDLQKMIEEKGTFEVFGSHNQDLDRKVDQIATDMAKLMDPASVARPSEVELVKQGLIESGLKNSNATAQQIIQNFKDEVNRRADVAYKIRGLETPALLSRDKTSLPKERIVGGKKFILQPDGSYEEAD